MQHWKKNCKWIVEQTYQGKFSKKGVRKSQIEKQEVGVRSLKKQQV